MARRLTNQKEAKMIVILLVASLLSGAIPEKSWVRHEVVRSTCFVVGQMKEKIARMEMVSFKQVREARAKIHGRYANRGLPYGLVDRVIGKVSYYHVNDLLRNWYALPRDTRDKIEFMFESAGLKHLTFLCFYESAANQNDRSYSGAVGLYQIMPRTAKLHCGIDLVEDLYDPVVNAACAIEILIEKGARENLVAGLVYYNGKLRSCPMRGYFNCFWEKYSAATDEKEKQKYLRAMMYVPNVLLHQAIGEELIWRREVALR